MTRVGVFHPGTQHSWQTALALQQLDRLVFYATSIFYNPDKWPYKLDSIPGPIGRRLHAEFGRFAKAGLDPALVHTTGLYEWAERIAARGGFSALATRIDAAGNARFSHNLSAKLRSPEPFALWGYDGSSRTSFEVAKQEGRFCVLDRTIGDPRAFNRAMDEIAEQYGDWFSTVTRRIPDSRIANDEREYELADVIVAGSAFPASTVVRESKVAGIADKVRVLPYCFDEALFSHVPAPRPVDRNAPVKFLFVGLVSPRKGIQLLLDAIERIPASQATLTIVGDMQVPKAMFAKSRDRVTFIPTVPRSQIPAIMAAHDVLVFPSYFEGSALSLIEGLASGLALIQSRFSGNGVTGETGIMLDPLNAETLLQAMLVPIGDRDLLDHWRSNAQAEAATYSFANYRANIAALLRDYAV